MVTQVTGAKLVLRLKLVLRVTLVLREATEVNSTAVRMEYQISLRKEFHGLSGDQCSGPSNSSPCRTTLGGSSLYFA